MGVSWMVLRRALCTWNAFSVMSAQDMIVFTIMIGKSAHLKR